MKVTFYKEWSREAREGGEGIGVFPVVNFAVFARNIFSGK